MKLIIQILFTSIVFISCATINFDWGPVVKPEERIYQRVFEFPDLAKDEIFSKTRMWMVKIFNDSESVIEYSDKEEGKIMGKYSQSDVTVNGMNATYKVKYTLTIEIKQNKARLTIEDPFMISYVSPYLQGQQEVNSIIDKEVFINSLKENQWPNLVESYEFYMASKNEDNW